MTGGAAGYVLRDYIGWLVRMLDHRYRVQGTPARCFRGDRGECK